MQAAYLIALVVSLCGLAVIDRRFGLVLWKDRRRAVKALAAGVALFVAWDIAGILLGIFYHGNGPYNLPFTVFPEFPVEEFFFLLLLCYQTLILFEGARRLRLWRRT